MLSSKFLDMTLKLTDRYASILLNMEAAVGRNENMHLVKEANVLWHQMESKRKFKVLSFALIDLGYQN